MRAAVLIGLEQVELRALELVRTGRLDLAPLVTYRLDLDAVAVAASKSDSSIKAP